MTINAVLFKEDIEIELNYRMSIESMIVANHLNMIQAGHVVCVALPSRRDHASAEYTAKLIALNLVCVIFGLEKALEIAAVGNHSKNV